MDKRLLPFAIALLEVKKSKKSKESDAKQSPHSKADFESSRIWKSHSTTRSTTSIIIMFGGKQANPYDEIVSE